MPGPCQYPGMDDLHAPLTLSRGPAMKNRFMLAPLTNLQSHADGSLSDDEFRWLVMRAAGGFGMTMTCAAHVQAIGQGFPGQLGVFDDHHLAGLTRLARALSDHGTHSVVQLHHAGMRSPPELLHGECPVAPSEDEASGARALSPDEICKLADDFISAALRCERAGFHGVELHAAHGYLLCQFLSREHNRRVDDHGGSLGNRCRLLYEIISGIRARCGRDFSVGVRLSPERFGMDLGEIREVAGQLMISGDVDYIDLSLWDVFKLAEDSAHAGRTLLGCFTDLPRGRCRLGAAGRLTGGEACLRAMQAGLDFVGIGRSAILHHDFPRKVAGDPGFMPIGLPVPEQHLADEGLGPAFRNYMRTWKGFVADQNGH